MSVGHQSTISFFRTFALFVAFLKFCRTLLLREHVATQHTLACLPCLCTCCHFCVLYIFALIGRFVVRTLFPVFAFVRLPLLLNATFLQDFYYYVTYLHCRYLFRCTQRFNHLHCNFVYPFMPHFCNATLYLLPPFCALYRTSFAVLVPVMYLVWTFLILPAHNTAAAAPAALYTHTFACCLVPLCLPLPTPRRRARLLLATLPPPGYFRTFAALTTPPPCLGFAAVAGYHPPPDGTVVCRA